MARIDEIRYENYNRELDTLKKRKRKKDMLTRIAEGPRDPWRDSRHGPMRELILTANKDFFADDLSGFFGVGSSIEQQFETLAVDWLRRTFGDDLVHARADLDEIAYHIHAVILPLKTENGRTMVQPSKHDVIADYEIFQDKIGEAFAPLGILRGEKRAEAVREAYARGETPPPPHYDHRFTDHFRETIAQDPSFEGFTYATLGELQEKGKIIIRGGHGSPSQEQRIGDVPYIKVSDLRAGHVNINPTNRVPRVVAERFWRGQESGLREFDLICPERTSKNIGDFCVLMPSQEQVLTTKEVIVLRATEEANFDQFYLLWAMTLKIVRDQWKRVIFMQTNREDVGKRYLEILVPVPPDEERGRAVSSVFRDYYTTIAAARTNLETYLACDKRHHFFFAGAEAALAELDDSEV